MIIFNNKMKDIRFMYYKKKIELIKITTIKKILIIMKLKYFNK